MPAAPALVSVWRPLAPRYWPVHVMAAAALTANILLGLWQLHAWQQHRAASAGTVTSLAPVPLDSVLGPDSAYPGSGLGRPVVVSGTWEPSQTVFVSGRTHEGRDGYWAVTPVTTASGSEIPVARGWLSDPASAPASPRGAASLVGLLQPAEDTGTTDENPRDTVIPELAVTDLLQRTHRDLYGGYVVATGRPVPGRSVGSSGTTSNGTAGLAPATAVNLPGADSTTALRNLLYAIQWWIFGAFVCLMWWRWLAEDVLGRQ